MRLNEDDTLLRVDASRQPVKHHFVNIFSKALRVFQSCERVNIYYAIDAVIFVLKGDVVADRSQIVANVLFARRPCARENAFFHSVVTKFST
jgi:hypothetical protein